MMESRGCHRLFFLSLISLTLILGWGAAPTEAADSDPPRPLLAFEDLEYEIALQETHGPDLLELPGVHAVGVSERDGEAVILVLAEEGADKRSLPAFLGGVRVVVEAAGRAFPINGGEGCSPLQPDGYDGCHSEQLPYPVPLGNSSSGEDNCNAGTMGFKVCQPSTRRIGYVTNNHVAASVTDDFCPNGPVGAIQRHPGRFEDRPTCSFGNFVGTLRQIVPITFTGTNIVDLAFVESSDAFTSRQIRDIGFPSILAGTPAVNQCVRKSGRTTGLTWGRIDGVNMMLETDYRAECGGTTIFEQQIRVVSDPNCGVCQNPPCDDFVRPGDSGSALLDLNNRVVGLIYAADRASQGAPIRGWANTIGNVLGALGLSLDPRDCDLPSLTITTPNGGESWQVGTQQTLRWSSVNVSGNVRLELSRNGGSTYELLFSSTANDGDEAWTVTGPATSNALLRITSLADPSVQDVSDAPFTIVPPPSLTLLEPLGGESWPVNTLQLIRWQSQGLSGNVRLSISRNGGGSFQTLVGSTADDGSYSWTVTGPETSQARIRVESLSDPSVQDTSGDFTLSAADVTVIEPENGDLWVIGSRHVLLWDAPGVTGNVNVEIQRQSGGPFEPLFLNTPNDGIQQWIATGPASKLARIRVSQASDVTVHGMSGGFSLTGSTYTVTSAGDGSDSNLGDRSCDDGTGACTLRAALEQAQVATSFVVVDFDIPTSQVPLLEPATPLPELTRQVVLDATTQEAGLVALSGAQMAADASGLVVRSSGSILRGLAVLSFPRHGIVIEGSALSEAVGTQVERCWIGVDPVTAQPAGNTRDGLRIFDSSSNVIGGARGEGNVVGGNARGIRVSGSSSSNNRIVGNWIGVDADGTSGLGNSSHGLLIANGRGTQVGDTSLGLGNMIVGNGGDGVAVRGGEGHTIRANSIRGNGGLGIDLDNDGVTPNDAGDADAGPNDLQNFPVITSVLVGTYSSWVQGTVDTEPVAFRDQKVIVDLYSSPSCDPSGHGEGAIFLGSVEVAIDANGQGSFGVRLTGALTPGDQITATTTARGSTSELSACFPVPI